MNPREWSDEDRAELEALVQAASAHQDATGDNGQAMARFLEPLLDDAEQAHRPWAAAIKRRAYLDGLAAWWTRERKRESVALVAYNGALVGKATRAGRRRALPDGHVKITQSLFSDFTFGELREWLGMIQGQINSLLINVDMAKKLLALETLVPSAETIGEALAARGQTLEEYLGESAA